MVYLRSETDELLLKCANGTAFTTARELLSDLLSGSCPGFFNGILRLRLRRPRQSASPRKPSMSAYRNNKRRVIRKICCDSANQRNGHAHQAASGLALQAHVGDIDDPVRVRVGQCAQKRRLYYSEDDCSGPDAQRHVAAATTVNVLSFAKRRSACAVSRAKWSSQSARSDS